MITLLIRPWGGGKFTEVTIEGDDETDIAFEIERRLNEPHDDPLTDYDVRWST